MSSAYSNPYRSGGEAGYRPEDSGGGGGGNPFDGDRGGGGGGGSAGGGRNPFDDDFGGPTTNPLSGRRQSKKQLGVQDSMSLL